MDEARGRRKLLTPLFGDVRNVPVVMNTPPLGVSMITTKVMGFGNTKTIAVEFTGTLGRSQRHIYGQVVRYMCGST